jgi:hypothetical protein
MSNFIHLFEPFDEETLDRIRSAYREARPHVLAGAQDPTIVRNRLVGTLAQLTMAGITDPSRLKAEAIRTLVPEDA